MAAMNNRKYTKEVRLYIAKSVPGRTTRELVELVNAKFGTLFTLSQLKSYKSNHKLRSGTPCGLPAGHASKQYPEEVKNYIIQNHRGISHTEMARQLNERFGTNYSREKIKCFYGNHKLNSGLTGRFEKGHNPINKGVKGVHLSPETEFKKGNMPRNHRDVGSERVNIDGYTEIKVAEPSKWRPKHHVVWEAANGPLPKGHVLIFADSDKTNIALDNLIPVTHSQLVRLNRNGLIHNDAELTRTGVIIASMMVKCGRRKAERKEMREE